jgi:hypothetical protein
MNVKAIFHYIAATVRIDTDYDTTHRLASFKVDGPVSVTLNFDHADAYLGITNKVTLNLVGTNNSALIYRKRQRMRTHISAELRRVGSFGRGSGLLGFRSG